MCHKDLGEEHREGNAPCGVLGSSSLKNYIIDDYREIYLGTFKDVVYEVGYLKSEIVLVDCWNEVVGEHTPIKLDFGLAKLIGELCASLTYCVHRHSIK